MDLFEEVLDDLFLVGAGGGIDPGAAVLELEALVEEEGDVAAVIDDKLRPEAVRTDDGLPSKVPVLFEGFALPGENGNSGGGDGGGGVVLGGENVTGGPADLGAEGDERLDENRGLDRHVQRPGDTNTGERLRRTEFFANGNEAGHLMLGDGDFLATPVGEFDVGDMEIGAGSEGRRDVGVAHGVMWR